MNIAYLKGGISMTTLLTIVATVFSAMDVMSVIAVIFSVITFDFKYAFYYLLDVIIFYGISKALWYARSIRIGKKRTRKAFKRRLRKL